MDKCTYDVREGPRAFSRLARGCDAFFADPIRSDMPIGFVNGSLKFLLGR